MIERNDLVAAPGWGSSPAVQGDSDLGDLGAPGTSRWWDLGVVEGARQAPRARGPRLSLPLPSSVNS